VKADYHVLITWEGEAKAFRRSAHYAIVGSGKDERLLIAHPMVLIL